MVRLRRVDESLVQDEAGRYLDLLSEKDRLPRLKNNKLGPNLKDVTDEERAIVRSFGHSE